MVVCEERNGENSVEKLSVKQRAQLETPYCFQRTHTRPTIDHVDFLSGVKFSLETIMNDIILSRLRTGTFSPIVS